MRKLITLLLTFFFFQLSGQQPAGFDIPVFAYHRFGDDRFPSTSVETAVFEAQLQYLRDKNYTALTFGQAVEKWLANEQFPDKAVILTVDDGYLSFYENGWPLLKKYNFPATIFIQTETVGNADFMTWEQIRKIQQAGIEIGNHSATHDHFLNHPEDSIPLIFKKDLEAAAEIFRIQLTESPKIYAYPYGEWNTAMEEVLRAGGYLAAAVQKSGVFCESSNTYAIPRFPMGGVYATLNGFGNKITMYALTIETTNPKEPFYKENPPALELKIANSQSLNLDAAQFFMEGEKMPIQATKSEKDFTTLLLQSNRKLKHRRTLYTLTAPSNDGKNWHWYSFLWVNPDVAE